MRKPSPKESDGCMPITVIDRPTIERSVLGYTHCLCTARNGLGLANATLKHMHVYALDLYTITFYLKFTLRNSYLELVKKSQVLRSPSPCGLVEAQELFLK